MNNKYWRLTLFFVLALGIVTASIASANSPNLNSSSAVSITLSDEGSTWTFYRSDPDLGRRGMKGVFDSHRQKVVMFGGERFGVLDETWEFDGVDWGQIDTLHSPPSRYWHGLAYDNGRQVTVLFGGHDDNETFNDTWEYDGVDWLQVTTLHTPPALSAFGMVYDSCRQKVVLFSGHPEWGTWEYNGQDWQQIDVSDSPDYRHLTAMAFDHARCRTVLFGGMNADVQGKNDTWEYDGANWIQIAVSAPPTPRWAHELVYDPTLRRIVLFGGYGPMHPTGAPLADTWEFDGYRWLETTPAISPAAEEQHMLVYDGNNQQVLFFGGLGNDETWFYRGREPFTIYIPLVFSH